MADFEKVLLDPSLKTAQELQMTWQELFEHRSSMQRATSARRHVATAAALKLPNSCDVEPGQQLQSAALVATAEQKFDSDDDMTGVGFDVTGDATVRSDTVDDRLCYVAVEMHNGKCRYATSSDVLMSDDVGSDSSPVMSCTAADHHGDAADGTSDCRFRGAESCDSGAHITVKTETPEGDCCLNSDDAVVYCDEIDGVDMLDLGGNDPADGYFYRGVIIFNYPE